MSDSMETRNDMATGLAPSKSRGETIVAAKSVRLYLESLSTSGTSPTSNGRRIKQAKPETIRKRLSSLEAKIGEEVSPLKRLGMMQKKRDYEAQLDSSSRSLEEEFVKHAKAYGERNGIGYATWREIGVPAPVLQKAGITRSS